MRSLSVNIPEDLHKKIKSIAQKSNLSYEDCIIKALSEYAETSEDFHLSDLCTMDSSEKSFFLTLSK